MSDESLPELAGQLRRLPDRPVHEHPEVLEEVHRTLVAELESLVVERPPEPSRISGADESDATGAGGEPADP